MSESPTYDYPSADQELALFVEAHQKHFVIATRAEWLRCLTCGVLCRITDGRRAGVVLRDEFGR